MQIPELPVSPFQLKLCFHKVIEQMEAEVAVQPGPYTLRTRELLAKIAMNPELREGLTDIAQIVNNEALIREMLQDLFPPALSNNEIKAVSIPYLGVIFNYTQRFRDILNGAGPGFDINIRDFNYHQYYVLSCCIILNQLYGTNLDLAKPLFFDIPTPEGITRHYRILYNSNFLEILPTENAVKLTQKDIDELMDSYNNLPLWEKKFPVGSYILKGFALMTLVDVTVENAVSIFKEKLIGINLPGFQESIRPIFQAIFRVQDINIGFTRYDKEKDKLKHPIFGQEINSFLLSNNEPVSPKDIFCGRSFRKIMQQKAYFAVGDVHEFYEENKESSLAKHFLASNIKSFILAPVVKNNVLFGIFEITSSSIKVLNTINANKMDVVMPFLKDTVERISTEFQNKLLALIQSNYTAIHPSVAWKFRAAIEKHMDAVSNLREGEIEDVVFTSLYPMYGQVDIKGSSQMRNQSIQKDLHNQMDGLAALLLKLNADGHEFEEDYTQVKSFINILKSTIKADTEQRIHNYMEHRLHPKLKKYLKTSPTPELKNYLKDAEKTGNFYANRRDYETTISMINEKLAEVIDNAQKEAQKIFPHYYERFKTDGIEHNLYVGQAIAPGEQFNSKKLHSLRLWQLKTICAMEEAHYRLKQDLPLRLNVRSIVLVSFATLSIRFRMDEKRFDVDGTYNTRFEIVKKRIDKAHIKNTKERIAKTGMLTIVFSNEIDEKNYIGYLDQLQKLNLVGPKIERIIVEDLQGVSGLKALRVKFIRQDKLAKKTIMAS